MSFENRSSAKAQCPLAKWPWVFIAEVIAAVFPLALAVPDGEFRLGEASPFAPAMEPAGGGELDRILRHLGRTPDRRQRYFTVTGA